MIPAPRRPGAPRAVVAAWGLSVVLGGAVVGVAAARPAPQPRTLSPLTLARYLEEIVPARPADVRVNGVYGSGHSGAWQFVAHVTWRDASGQVNGGVTNLPVLAGRSPIDTPVDVSRLPAEHEIGWTLDELDDVLGRPREMDDGLAMVEVEVTAARDSLVACHSSGPDALATCVEHDRSGRRIRRFEARLTDEPFGEALSVQRR